MLLWAVAAAAAHAGPRPTAVQPLAPEDGAYVGGRPVFEIDYESPAELEPRTLSFRIVLQPLVADGEAKPLRFDQRRNRSGWLPGAPGRILYRPRKPLPHGRYRWTAESWNGVDWTRGSRTFELTIDAVPPAEVEGLELTFARSRGEVVLEWDPVALDRKGGPEHVVRYRVYRYERKDTIARVRTFEAGTVESPRFVDPVAPAAQARILFYRVVAEDAAGNIAGVPGL